MADVRVGGALQVTGLREAINGAAALSKDLPKAVTRANRAIAKETLAEARANWRRVALGGQARYATKALTALASRTSASIKLSDAKTPFSSMGVEFGAIIHHVFGRGIPQSAMRRRVYPRWVGNQFTRGQDPRSLTGHVVAPAIRDRVQQIQDTYERTVTDAIKAAI